MAEPVVDREAVSASVKKDDTSRLVAELKGCFPGADVADIQKLTREELVERVIRCRLHMKQTSKVTCVLEGVLPITFAKAGGKTEEVTVTPSLTPDLASVMMAMNKMFMDQLAAQEKIRAEKEARDEKIRAEERKAALEKVARDKKEALEKETRDQAYQLQLIEKANALKLAEQEKRRRRSWRRGLNWRRRRRL